ncbi:MAG: HDIG domain-containing protein [Muribaculaceae bacterium]|nr:HDIG domain-containing protein [Muribaculaceae bacterium]
MDFNTVINKYYPADSPLRDIYLRHCRQVADMAISIARSGNLPLDETDIEAAAMLHDIGIILTDAPSIHCTGQEPYIRHGILGAEILRKEGYPEKWARVAERHTGSGLTADEIIEQNLPLPPRDYLPETLLEQLICYADKFFSKSGDMQQKSIEKVERSMQRFGEPSLQRFLKLKEVLGQ